MRELGGDVVPVLGAVFLDEVTQSPVFCSGPGAFFEAF
jgi:hypothetical protein